MIISFLLSLAALVGIGLASAFFSRNTKSDYYLASQSVPPALVGLSAVATNNSGYMFIGAIGYTYAVGFASLWLMVGWILGDFIASLFIYLRLRHAAEATGELSYAGVLSHWANPTYAKLHRLISVISLIFLTAYASAQFIAGSKALHVLLDWPLWAGAVISAFLVMVYCLAGGIRASIWTDAAQSLIMIVAMSTLLVSALLHLGGPSAAYSEMQAIDGFTHWAPTDMPVPGLAGVLVFFIGWLFAGLSVAGQPHIMVRFMTLNDTRFMRRAKLWYYSWFTVFYAMAVGVGLLARVYLSETQSFDAELALPTMAYELLPPLLVGVVLAGIFAATMSTADSLVLSCSAAITHDLMPQKIESLKLIKGITVVITLAALGWALVNSQSVFNLVVMAWSSLASAFVPLLIALCVGWRPPQGLCLVVVLLGMAVALGWRWLGWHGVLYEGLPGIGVGILVLGGWWVLRGRYDT